MGLGSWLSVCAQSCHPCVDPLAGILPSLLHSHRRVVPWQEGWAAGPAAHHQHEPWTSRRRGQDERGRGGAAVHRCWWPAAGGQGPAQAGLATAAAVTATVVMNLHGFQGIPPKQLASVPCVGVLGERSALNTV